MLTGSGAAQAGQDVGRAAALLRLQVPKGAIEPVARRATRQQALQTRPVETVQQRLAQCLDRRRNTGSGFTVPRIGGALAAAPIFAVLELDHDHVGLASSSRALMVKDPAMGQASIATLSMLERALVTIGGSSE